MITLIWISYDGKRKTIVTVQLLVTYLSLINHVIKVNQTRQQDRPNKVDEKCIRYCRNNLCAWTENKKSNIGKSHSKPRL